MNGEYNYKIALYRCEDCMAWFQLGEDAKGRPVPVRRCKVSTKGKCTRWDISEVVTSIKWRRENGHGDEELAEVQVYEEILKDSPKLAEVLGTEARFWKRVQCLWFFQRVDGAFVISAMQKSMWRRYAFKGYIKKISIPANYSQTEFAEVVEELLDVAESYQANPRKSPVNVCEVRQDESVGKHEFPWHITAYKSEKRYLFVPYLDHVGGFLHQSEDVVVTDRISNPAEIGRAVMEAVDIIKRSPRMVGVTSGHTKATGYESWEAFTKRNRTVNIRVYQDFSYEIFVKRQEPGGREYEAGEHIRLLAPNTEEEIGRAVIGCFAE